MMMLSLNSKGKKGNSKIKKVILGIILAIMPFIVTSCTVMVIVSSVTMNFFANSSVDENLTEEENNQMLEEVKNKTEWINNNSTFDISGKRIGQLSDYYGTDIRFKLGWSFTLAYLKYQQMNNDDSSVNTAEDVERKIEKAAVALAPKFIYKKDKIVTVREYVVTEQVQKIVNGEVVYETEDVVKQDVREEEKYFIVNAQNIQGTYEISYRSETQTSPGNNETVTVTKPVIQGIKQTDDPYAVLKYVIGANNYDEDVNKAADGIISIAYNYLGEDVDGLDMFSTGSGTFTGSGEAFNGNSQKFIEKVASGAIKSRGKYGILPSITIAQAILESGWGKSGLTGKANNLFGAKAFSSWTGPYVEMLTKEYTSSGSAYYVLAKFRAYNTWDDSIDDHSKILMQDNFSGVRAAKDYKEAAYALKEGGYATDPDYPKLIISFIESYNLNQYDVNALANN